MKSIHLIIWILFFSNSLFSQEGWFELNTGMTINQHGAIEVINENIVYVISDGGFFYKSIDGGTNWTEININVDEQFYGMEFIDANTGFIVGTNGTVLKTNDAGNNWIQINTGTTENIHSIYIADTNNLWCVGENGTILHSIDGGNVWLLDNSTTTSNLFDIKFTDNMTGIIVGQNGLFLKTINAGTTWNPPTTSFDFLYDGFSISITDTIIRFVSGGASSGNYAGYEVFKSIDNGETWNIELEYTMCASSHITSIDFVNDNVGFLVDFSDNYQNGTIVKMTDGENYNYISKHLNNYEMNRFYSKIEFFNEDIVYFLSGNVLLKTIDGGVFVNGVDDFETQGISVYPNPTSDSIVISSAYNVISHIIISDITGKELIKSKETSLSIKNLKEGIYWSQI